MKIKSIHVEKLFGYYDYTLDVNENLPELLILFGDNGAGKTTILKMLYDVLKREKSDTLKKTPFNYFEIFFEDKSILKTFKHSTTIDIRDFNSPTQYTIIFLTENRKIWGKSSLYHSKGDNGTISQLAQTLYQYLKQKQIRFSQTGESSSQGIYKAIIAQMQAATNGSDTENHINYKAEITEKIKNLEERSEKFSKYGLITPFNIGEINSMVSMFSEEQMKIAYSTIMPYLDSQSAQLDALSSLQQDIHTFVTTVNSYFFDKKMTFHLSKGFSLHYTHEPYTELPFDTLSSGEKHFLRLLCNILMVSDEFTLFLIDEPEISLDVEWRRKLLKTFLTLGKNKNLQFIIATHSLELLASYRENIAQLKHQSAVTNG